jgi:hypothetical protein
LVKVWNLDCITIAFQVPFDIRINHTLYSV